ncbi:uncharacterized protein TNCV_3646341 [Trichonephila clavipes]|nr:uncharacterized protein TNCV_3646341 [Trichonephila clavipes]
MATLFQRTQEVKREGKMQIRKLLNNRSLECIPLHSSEPQLQLESDLLILCWTLKVGVTIEIFGSECTLELSLGELVIDRDYGIDLEFAEQKNGLIRERIVLGVKDSELQKRLHGENNLGLEKATEIVREAEVSREPIRNMTYETATVNFVRLKENQNKPKTQYDLKNLEENSSHECPAFGKICTKCNKKNRFAVKKQTSHIYTVVRYDV